MKKKYKIIIFILPIMLFLITDISHSSGNNDNWRNAEVDQETNQKQEKEENIVLKINNNKITNDELFYWIENNKNQVISKYFDKDEEISWDKKVDDEYVYEILFNLTIEDIKRNYTILDLAYEEEFIEDKTFNGLVNRWKLENKLREQKIKNQEVVYGLSEFTLNQYIKYELDNLILNLKNNADLDILNINENEIEEFYEENKDLYKSESSIEIKYIKLDYYLENLSENEVTVLKEDLNNIYNLLENGSSFEESIERFPIFEEYYTHRIYTGEEVASDYRANGDLWAIVSQLEEDEISEVVNYNDRLLLVQFIDEVEGKYRGLSEVKALILAKLKDDYFEQYITDYIEESEVIIVVEDINQYIQKVLNEGVEDE